MEIHGVVFLASLELGLVLGVGERKGDRRPWQQGARLLVVAQGGQFLAGDRVIRVASGARTWHDKDLGGVKDLVGVGEYGVDGSTEG